MRRVMNGEHGEALRRMMSDERRIESVKRLMNTRSTTSMASKDTVPMDPNGANPMLHTVLRMSQGSMTFLESPRP
jgi:hypothetical protein